MARKRRAKKVVSSDQEDRLSDLPDDVLQHVLGFLPVHEAVRTSVLASRWCHVWKSIRRLHITSPGEDWEENNAEDLCNFVSPLLQLRDHVILDEVKFDYDPYLHEQTNIWFRHVLLCQAQVLIVYLPSSLEQTTLEDPPLVSRHLRKLELTDVRLEGKFLDFASCPALEVLEMTDCNIQTERILSPSIKLLRIESSTFTSYGDRTCISVPSLFWLQLNNFDGTAPFLESMPSLETASVKPAFTVEDSCEHDDSGECCGMCADCCGNDDHKGRCVLLEGLSSAVNLELTAYPRMFLFKRDLNWCPTFSKLKNLLLNNWCVAVDLSALVCILKHSPVLENLTLQLRKGLLFTTQMEGNNISIEKSDALSVCLNTIKIKCEEVDDRVCKLLKFLSTLDIEVAIEKTKK